MRRLRMLPVSIAAHAIAVLVLLIIPLAAEVERPVPAPLARPGFIAAKVIPVPWARPLARSGQPSRATNAVPVAAGSGVLPERDVQPIVATPGLAVDGGLGVGVTGDVPGAVGTVVPIPEPPAPVVPPPPPKIIRVGGDVREPRKLFDVRPVYPGIAQAGHIQGTVMLDAVINERGVVERIRVLRSVALLDAAAIEAVRQWRYTPTLLNGQPVPVLMTITITFTLRD